MAGVLASDKEEVEKSNLIVVVLHLERSAEGVTRYG
jgi:hypothetical protein